MFPGLDQDEDEDDDEENNDFDETFFDNGISQFGQMMGPLKRLKTLAYINGHPAGSTTWNAALCPCIPKPKKKKKCCGGPTVCIKVKGGGCGGGCSKKKKQKKFYPWMQHQQPGMDWHQD
ncbi:hypothetical protein GEMRC1_009814 [Eukaryota sp. GEM-RC1]